MGPKISGVGGRARALLSQAEMSEVGKEKKIKPLGNSAHGGGTFEPHGAYLQHEALPPYQPKAGCVCSTAGNACVLLLFARGSQLGNKEPRDLVLARSPAPRAPVLVQGSDDLYL